MFVLFTALAYKSRTTSDDASPNVVDIRRVPQIVFKKNTPIPQKPGQMQMQPQHVFYQPDAIVCNNTRRNSFSPRWKCEASDSGVTLTEYTIDCLGVHGENDYMVFEDSCSIAYDLTFKADASARYGEYIRNPDYQKYQKMYGSYGQFFNNGYFDSRRYT